MIGLYAIVTTVPAGATDPAGTPLRVVKAGSLVALAGPPSPGVSPEALRAHEATVRKIADKTDACLPARFGAAAEDEAALIRELERREAELTAALDLVRGREQMTLRVRTSPPARKAGRRRSGTRYLEDRRRSQQAPELDPLRTRLRGLIRAEKIERASEVLVSVYHLVDRGQAEAYARAIAAQPLDGLEVSVSGPWPAWSFAP
jgi:gas vesicle protein GvpL/GvpF